MLNSSNKGVEDGEVAWNCQMAPEIVEKAGERPEHVSRPFSFNGACYEQLVNKLEAKY